MTMLPIHAKVACTDSPGGHLIAVIVDPTRRDITHIVVHYMHEKYLVPIKYLADISDRTIQLYCSNSELTAMEFFAEKRFIRSEHPETPHMIAYPFPQGIPLVHSRYGVPAETDVLFTEVFYPPPGELAIHHGSDVWAKDGPMGRVSEVRMADNSHHITHVVVEVDGFFRKRKMILPLTAIEQFENDTVYLKWDHQTIEHLPESAP